MSDIFKGATDVTRYVMIVDSATGAPETGVTISNLDMQYTRNRSAPAAKVDMVALAATDTAHTDGRGIEVDATSSPGLYRIDWPDAAFATGADKVMLVVTGTGFAPAVELIDLVNVNNQVAYVPNAAADAAGGLPISDAGGLDLDAKLANTNEVTAARMGALTDWINGGRLDLILDIIAADTTTDIPALIAALNNIAATDIVSGGAITTSGGIASADAKKMNGVTIVGTGISSDLWRA